jgi:ketosteroid isomerase-like protein
MQSGDHDLLLSLNKDYINSVQNSDVARFDEILAEDFRCSNPDGTFLDRQEFLAQTGKPVSVSELQARDVLIRQFGDCAIIHATTSYLDAQGNKKKGRYTDVWIKDQGTWLAVSAHITRA